MLRLVVEPPATGDDRHVVEDVSGTWRETGVKRVIVRIPDALDVSIGVGVAR